MSLVGGEIAHAAAALPAPGLRQVMEGRGSFRGAGQSLLDVFAYERGVVAARPPPPPTDFGGAAGPRTRSQELPKARRNWRSSSSTSWGGRDRLGDLLSQEFPVTGAEPVDGLAGRDLGHADPGGTLGLGKGSARVREEAPQSLEQIRFPLAGPFIAEPQKDAIEQFDGAATVVVAVRGGLGGGFEAAAFLG